MSGIETNVAFMENFGTAHQVAPHGIHTYAYDPNASMSDRILGTDITPDPCEAPKATPHYDGGSVVLEPYREARIAQQYADGDTWGITHNKMGIYSYAGSRGMLKIIPAAAGLAADIADVSLGYVFTKDGYAFSNGESYLNMASEAVDVVHEQWWMSATGKKPIIVTENDAAMMTGIEAVHGLIGAAGIASTAKNLSAGVSSTARAGQSLLSKIASLAIPADMAFFPDTDMEQVTGQAFYELGQDIASIIPLAIDGINNMPHHWGGDETISQALGFSNTGDTTNLSDRFFEDTNAYRSNILKSGGRRYGYIAPDQMTPTELTMYNGAYGAGMAYGLTSVFGKQAINGFKQSWGGLKTLVGAPIQTLKQAPQAIISNWKSLTLGAAIFTGQELLASEIDRQSLLTLETDEQSTLRGKASEQLDAPTAQSWTPGGS